MPTNFNVSETDRNWSSVLTFRRYKQHWGFFTRRWDVRQWIMYFAFDRPTLNAWCRNMNWLRSFNEAKLSIIEKAIFDEVWIWEMVPTWTTCWQSVCGEWEVCRPDHWAVSCRGMMPAEPPHTLAHNGRKCPSRTVTSPSLRRPLTSPLQWARVFSTRSLALSQATRNFYWRSPTDHFCGYNLDNSFEEL